ncbi:hypothetical protein HMN09_00770900 [Mycena chlorophos]|uniref:Uncharacterized protein n=1 Tax=Mycena chlorophos TaxID=658473 RepID=A0A8H6SVC0_MYCCL|nr:hypothetical protein HMN09_00770900 [Mycena chlorophos]
MSHHVEDGQNVKARSVEEPPLLKVSCAMVAPFGVNTESQFNGGTGVVLLQLAATAPERITGFSSLTSADQSKIRLAMARRQVDPADKAIANPSLDLAGAPQTSQKRSRETYEASQASSSAAAGPSQPKPKTVINLVDGEEEEVEADEPALDELYTTMTTQVVGVQYYQGLVSPGQAVNLVREPSNRYDSNAVQVKNIQNIQVGHLPRTVSASLAPLLDGKYVSVEGLMNEGNMTSRARVYTLSIDLKIYGSGLPQQRAFLEPRLIWATPGRRGFPSSSAGPSSSAPSSSQAPPRSQAGGSSKKAQTAAQIEAARRMAEEQQKANALKAALDTMEKVDDERRRNSLLDQLLSADDIFNLPTCPDAPGKGKGLRVDLLRHQAALQWALERENPVLPQKESDKPVQFWQLRAGGIYFNLAASTPQREKPVLNRGAICADAMGLGKTLTMLALILVTKKQASPGYSNSTLIVAPLSVLSNWEKQIQDHCLPGALTYYVYHGKYSPRSLSLMPTETASEKKREISAAELQRYDVVIATYQTRVILDEAHTIRNPKTKLAKGAFALEAERRWALAATPIDLGSLLHFLRICAPLDSPDMYNRLVIRKIKNGDPDGAKLLRNLMTHICLRRTKEMQDSQGRALVPLPPVEMIKVQIALPAEAREVYDQVEEISRDRVAAYLRSGSTVAQASILSILTRLRQMVLHTSLVPPDYLEQLRTVEEPDNAPKQAQVLTAHDKIQLQAKLSQAIEECEDELTDARITSCMHVFCNDCISESLNRNQQCPMDRRPLSAGDLHKLEEAPDATQAPFQDKSETAEGGSSAKIDQLVELLKLTPRNDKALVFSQFTSFLDRVADRFDEEGIEYIRFDGRMSGKRREEAIAQFSVPLGTDNRAASADDSDEDFIDDDDDDAPRRKKGKGKGKQRAKASAYSGSGGNPKVMLISLKAGALGLNLTVANHVFLMDPWWQEGIESQAIDRVNRIGQTKSVRVYQMIAENTVESKVLEIQDRKKQLIKHAFSGIQQRETPRQQREARLADLVALFGLEGQFRLEIRAQDSGAAFNDVHDSEVYKRRVLSPKTGSRDMEPFTLVFAKVDGLELSVDVYIPSKASPTEKAPICLRFHGGGLVQGTRTSLSPHQLAAIETCNLCIVSADYRLAPQTRLPGILSDCKAAMEFVSSEGFAAATGDRVDVSKLVVSGSSAGGFLALLCGTGIGFAACGLAPPPNVKGIAAIYPITDLGDAFWTTKHHPPPFLQRVIPESEVAVFLDPAAPQSCYVPNDVPRGMLFFYAVQEGILEKLVLEGTDIPAPAVAIGPQLKALNKLEVPIYLVHGDADQLVPVKQSRDVEAALQEINASDHTYEEVPGVDHLYDRSPGYTMDNMYAFISRITR